MKEFAHEVLGPILGFDKKTKRKLQGHFTLTFDTDLWKNVRELVQRAPGTVPVTYRNAKEFAYEVLGPTSIYI